MNENGQHLTLPEPPPVSDPTHENSLSGPKRNGKIPHLSKEQRDLINHLFDEGATYDAVSRKLAEQGVSLNATNLHGWFHGGYQDELRRRERRAQLIESQEHLLAVATKTDAPALSLAGLQLAVTQLSEQLYELAPGSHKQAFETDTNHYLRMLNTLARMSKALLALQQYQDAAAKAKAGELQEKDPDRELSDPELGLIVDRMDRVFKIRRPRQPVPAADPPAHEAAPVQNQNVESAPITPSLRAPATPLPAPQIQNQNSKIEIPPVPDHNPETVPPNPAPHPEPADPPPIQNQNSQIQISTFADHNSAAPVAENALVVPESDASGVRPAHYEAALSTDNPTIHQSTNPSPALQHSSTPIPTPGRCPTCNLLLPPLLKNGERPIPVCPKCGSGLYGTPHWTPFPAPPPNSYPSACDLCRQRHKLDPNGLSDPCPQCGLHQPTQPP